MSETKTILVTGAGRGLGLAIARRLLADGYNVVATARSSSDGLDEMIARQPDRCAFMPHDLNDVDGLHDFVKRVVAAHGAIFGLVNNAAIGVDGVLSTMHNSDIERTLRVNTMAPIVLSKYVARSMMLKGGGRIVNVSSIIASTGFSGLAVYAASKAAIEGFTRSLARELGRVGITVNAVAPGYMETDMTSLLQGEKLQSVVRRSPLGRLASVDDVAGGVAYLLGPDAASVTGTVLTIDGGSTA